MKGETFGYTAESNPLPKIERMNDRERKEEEQCEVSCLSSQVEVDGCQCRNVVSHFHLSIASIAESFLQVLQLDSGRSMGSRPGVTENFLEI